MTPIPTTRGGPRSWTIALLLLPFLFAASPAFGQDPVVTAADPDMAEQETYDLVVKISGSNFGVDSQVDFYVAGTTDPGGIHVKNVKRKNPKTLEATIDVAPDAAVELFDIQVRTNGRTGKGTELFRVLAKVTGPDTTPPETVSDFTLIDEPILTPDGDYVAQLAWTSPTDDRGRVYEVWLHAKPGASFTAADSEDFWPYWFVTSNQPQAGLPAPPGEPDTGAIRPLAPDTQYTATLESRDEAGNWSGLSNPVTFWTGPVAPSPWQAEEIDACPPGGGGPAWVYTIGYRLAVGADGSAFVLYSRRCEDEPLPGTSYSAFSSDGWTRRPFPHGEGCALGIDPTGNVPMVVDAKPDAPAEALRLYRWNSGSEAWEPAVVDSAVASWECALGFRDGGGASGPVIAYRAPGKGQGTKIRLALWTGTDWEKHDLASTGNRGDVNLAFDPSGRPAVVYADDTNRDRYPDTVRLALWTGASWQVETVFAVAEPEERFPVPDVAWNSARGEFWVAASSLLSGQSGGRVRVCSPSLNPGSWMCELVPEPVPFGDTALDFDDHGTLFIRVGAYEDPWPNGGQIRLRIWSRDTRDPASAWTGETAAWDDDGFSGSNLAVDPVSGLPVVVAFAQLHPIPSLRLLRRLP